MKPGGPRMTSILEAQIPEPENNTIRRPTANLAAQRNNHVATPAHHRLGGDASLTSDQLIQARATPADLLRESRLTHPHGLQKFLKQHLTRMKRIVRLFVAFLVNYSFLVPVYERDGVMTSHVGPGARLSFRSSVTSGQSSASASATYQAS